MFKSTFVKYTVAFAVILIVSFVLLSGIITGTVRQHIHGENIAKLENTASAVSNHLSATMHVEDLENSIASGYTVMMLTPSLSAEVLCRLRDALTSLPRRTPITQQPPRLLPPERAMGIREALMSVTERLTVGEAMGRVLAQTGVGCPPAVPIGVSGEIVSPQMVEAFNYYGIGECTVVVKT